jgi:CubicO group peptidase (beta-lactamase class C family)
MRKFYLLFVLFIGACSSAALAQKEKLERLMSYYVTHDNFNGTVLVVRKGSVLLSKSYGFRNVGNKTKNTENTIYQLGTNTRQFTAEVILQLDSKGRLGLEDKLAKYIPDYPNGDKITLRNLLTNSSGIYNYTSDPLFTGRSAESPMSKDAITAKFKRQPLAFSPGTNYQNSNSGYFLVGMVIEKITHKKYEREVKEDILYTCDMSHTGFDFIHLRNENKATGYNFNGTFAVAPIIDSTVSYAGGAMYSTAGDLLKWHNSLVHHRLLPKDWQDLAYTPFKNNYALGWNISTAYNRKFMEHGGEISGFTSYIMRQEDDDVVVILLENVVRTGTSQAFITHNIVQCLYDKTYTTPGERKEVLPSPVTPIAIKNEPAEMNDKAGKAMALATITQLKKYEGTFEVNPAFTLTFTLKGNELYAATPEHKSIKMVQESETLFRTAGLNAQIEFVKLKNGMVNKIVLHQQGQLIPGVRSK